MRKSKLKTSEAEFSILTVDDDEIMTVTIKSYFESLNYRVDIENDPVQSIERVRTGDYDILLLDFLMRPICGDEVVRRVREFNKEIFIILLTGHKSMAPPIKTVRELEIQGYYEKSDRFDQLELLIESCIKSIRQMKTIRRYRDGLKNILDNIPLLYSYKDILLLLDKIIEEALFILSGSNGYIYIDTKAAAGEEIQGLPEGFYTGKGVYQTYNCEAAKKLMNNLCDEAKFKITKNAGYINAPLFTAKKELIGVINIGIKNELDSENLLIFEMYIQQVASVINNLLFQTLLSKKNNALQTANNDLHENLMETVNAMRLIVDMRDIYTRGHSDRVSYYAVLIAKDMNQTPQFIERVRIAGLFHDIGKVGIPDSILLKDKRLTDDEFEIVKKHPAYGRKILSSIKQFDEILDVIEDHHRYFNNGGYPLSKANKTLLLETRIITAADSFDAMTSKRTYREAMNFDTAIKELKNCSGRQFDPEVVTSFLKVLENYDSIIKELDWTFYEAREEVKGGLL